MLTYECLGNLRMLVHWPGILLQQHGTICPIVENNSRWLCAGVSRLVIPQCLHRATWAARLPSCVSITIRHLGPPHARVLNNPNIVLHLNIVASFPNNRGPLLRVSTLPYIKSLQWQWGSKKLPRHNNLGTLLGTAAVSVLGVHYLPFYEVGYVESFFPVLSGSYLFQKPRYLYSKLLAFLLPFIEHS